MANFSLKFDAVCELFGSVALRRTRHAIAVGLTADIVAVIAAVILCHLVFG